MNPLLFFGCFFVPAIAIAFMVDRAWHMVRKYRIAQIRNLALPSELFHKLRQRHPQLRPVDCELVADGLRQFFMAHLKSRRSHLAMPSQVVDDLWHEFILHTKTYQKFCRRAFGGFLHHVPATEVNINKKDNGGIRRTWHYACKEEDIDPKQPKRLPLLFALDTQLNITNGFTYITNCAWFDPTGAMGSSPYCATNLGSPASGCGGMACSGGCGNDCISGCGGGCGGGCGSGSD